MFGIIHRRCWARPEPSSWVSRPKLARTFRTESGEGGPMHITSVLAPGRMVAAGRPPK